jgi:hypothetical protein
MQSCERFYAARVARGLLDNNYAMRRLHVMLAYSMNANIGQSSSISWKSA